MLHPHISEKKNMQPIDDLSSSSKNRSKKQKTIFMLLLLVPGFIVWISVWILRDAMICGVCLVLFYLITLKMVKRAMHVYIIRDIIRKDFSGNYLTKVKYQGLLSLVGTLIFVGINVLYFAYISWGPKEIKLPFPSSHSPSDSIYYFWLTILFMFLIPPLECGFFFGLQTFCLDRLYGQLMIPVSYAFMNIMWIIPVIGGDLWRVFGFFFFGGLGYLFYRIRLSNDSFRLMAIRCVFSNAYVIVIFYLLLAKDSASPTHFQKFHEDNVFMGGPAIKKEILAD